LFLKGSGPSVGDALTFNVTRGIAVTRQERAQSRFDR
jgi:hypothetical protein